MSGGSYIESVANRVGWSLSGIDRSPSLAEVRLRFSERGTGRSAEYSVSERDWVRADREFLNDLARKLTRELRRPAAQDDWAAAQDDWADSLAFASPPPRRDERLSGPRLADVRGWTIPPALQTAPKPPPRPDVRAQTFEAYVADLHAALKTAAADAGWASAEG